MNEGVHNNHYNHYIHDIHVHNTIQYHQIQAEYA